MTEAGSPTNASPDLNPSGIADTPPPNQQHGPVTAPRLEPQLAIAGAAWTSFGGDLAHSRSNQYDSPVNPNSVRDLTPAISVPAPGVTSTPALYGGTLYWADWGGHVHATDPRSGEDIWSLDRSADGGGYVGSPAVTAGRVFVASRNGLVSALDLQTGVPVWETDLTTDPLAQVWSSPAVADGILVLGVGEPWGRDNGRPLDYRDTFRGRVVGLDPDTGETRWVLWTTLPPDGPGAGVWSSAALDIDRRLAFIGVGRNFEGPVGSYSKALLAIDYETGALVWAAQPTRDQAFAPSAEFGIGAAPNLFSTSDDMVGIGSMDGHYRVYERETGTLVWEAGLTRGSFLGGIMAPAAFLDGVLYVVSNRGTAGATLFAVEANAGKTLWQADLSAVAFGAPAVGAGLAFVTDNDGTITGFDIEAGTQVWSYALPGGSAAGTSFAGGLLTAGWGFHMAESRREPLAGGLVGFALGGQAHVHDPVAADTP